MCLAQVSGKHSEIYNHLKEEILRMVAHTEAFIDFEADETADARLSDSYQHVLEDANNLAD